MLRGDPKLGALIRELRSSRNLTLATVARRVGCAESLLSQVETGTRHLRPWLAEALDVTFHTGGSITALLSSTSTYPGMSTERGDHRESELICVRVPGRGVTVPISRRDVLSALGIGAVGGTLLQGLHRAAADVRVDEETVGELERTLTGLQAAGRIMPPAQVVGPLTGQVALLDALRRHAHPRLHRALLILQARYAESLSWMSEEAGDLTAAVYWTDRAAHWAQIATWPAMTAYTHIRRSMLAVSFSSDGPAAVEQAVLALRTPDAPPRIRGLAAKQMAYGYALSGRPDATSRALDLIAAHFDRAVPGDEDGPIVGQRSVNDPDLLLIYRATSEVYLGGGDLTITALAPRMTAISHQSARTHAITAAKLAQAYANLGEPGQACSLIHSALDAAASVDSLTTRAELHRALPTLERWAHRDDVSDVRHHLTTTAQPPGNSR